MRILTICLLFFTLTAFNGNHKFYVSTTDIEFVAEKQELQIISKVFIDDMESLLKQRYSEALFLGKNAESNDVDKYISKYFTEKFKVKVDGKLILAEYLGHTYDDDLLKCFLKAEGVTTLKNVEISSTILMDVFDDQQNVVHINNGKKIKSVLLMKDRESDVVTFK